MGHTDFIVEYRNLVDRLGGRARDFWSAYIETCGDRAYQPVRFLKLPLIELPQVRLQQPTLANARSLNCPRSSLPSGRFNSHRQYQSPWHLFISCSEHRACLWTT